MLVISPTKATTTTLLHLRTENVAQIFDLNSSFRGILHASGMWSVIIIIICWIPIKDEGGGGGRRLAAICRDACILDENS